MHETRKTTTHRPLARAICTALAAGAFASSAGYAQEMNNSQSAATAAPDTTTTRSTSSATTMNADQSPQASQPTTAGYGAPATTTATGATQSARVPDASNDYDQSRTAGANSGSNRQAKDQDQVLWFVVPVALEKQGSQFSNGCWVRLYSGDNFDGRYVSIIGPTSIREMRSPYGTGMNNWESAVVGPNATVTTYDDEDFRARNATLRAGQRYPDLDDSKLGLFDDIESIKVSCNGASGPGSGM